MLVDVNAPNVAESLMSLIEISPNKILLCIKLECGSLMFIAINHLCFILLVHFTGSGSSSAANVSIVTCGEMPLLIDFLFKLTEHEAQLQGFIKGQNSAVEDWTEQTSVQMCLTWRYQVRLSTVGNSCYGNGKWGRCNPWHLRGDVWHAKPFKAVTHTHICKAQNGDSKVLYHIQHLLLDEQHHYITVSHTL